MINVGMNLNLVHEEFKTLSVTIECTALKIAIHGVNDVPNRIGGSALEQLKEIIPCVLIHVLRLHPQAYIVKVYWGDLGHIVNMGSVNTPLVPDEGIEPPMPEGKRFTAAVCSMHNLAKRFQRGSNSY